MKTRGFALLMTLVLTVCLLAGCGSDLTPVYVQSVSSIMGYGDMGEFNISAGVVTAQNEVKIEKDSDRKVSELKVEVGQAVKTGDVLFVYDTDQMRLNIDKAKLEIEQLKNNVTDYGKQIAELEKSRNSAPESEKLGYTVQIQALEADRKEAQYNITVKEKDLEALQNEDVSGEVKATIDGTVKAINENGGYDDYTGQPLPYITLIQSGAYRVKGKTNELNRSEFYVGQRVILRSRTDSTQTWTGTVSEIDENPQDNSNSGYGYYYDGSSDEMTSSSSYPFYVELDGTDGLILGQHLYIEPDNGQNDQTQGLRLDASFVVVEDDGSCYAWAADKRDKLEKRAITVGELDEALYQYEILSGLTEDDRIAVPSDSLQEGAPVTDTLPEPDDSTDGDNNGVIDDAADFDGNFDGGVVDGGVIDGGMSGEEKGGVVDGGEAPVVEGGVG